MPSGPSGRAVDRAGQPRAIFSGAIERGNLIVAEMAAREVGNLTLEEALRLLCLYAEKEAQLAASALGELRGGDGQHAARF